MCLGSLNASNKKQKIIKKMKTLKHAVFSQYSENLKTAHSSDSTNRLASSSFCQTDEDGFRSLKYV